MVGCLRFCYALFWLVGVILPGVVGLLVMLVLLTHLVCVWWFMCLRFSWCGAVSRCGCCGVRVGCGLSCLCGLLVGLVGLVAGVVFPGLW